jgi:hypothetical protein
MQGLGTLGGIEQSNGSWSTSILWAIYLISYSKTLRAKAKERVPLRCVLAPFAAFI